MLVSIVMVDLDDPEGRHMRSSMTYSRYGRAPGVPAAAKIRPLMSRQDVREIWVILLRDVPVCRSKAPKIRHGGPDLRRDAAAGGDVVMIHDLKK